MWLDLTAACSPYYPPLPWVFSDQFRHALDANPLAWRLELDRRAAHPDAPFTTLIARRLCAPVVLLPTHVRAKSAQEWRSHEPASLRWSILPAVATGSYLDLPRMLQSEITAQSSLDAAAQTEWKGIVVRAAQSFSVRISVGAVAVVLLVPYSCLHFFFFNRTVFQDKPYWTKVCWNFCLIYGEMIPQR